MEPGTLEDDEDRRTERTVIGAELTGRVNGLRLLIMRGRGCADCEKACDRKRRDGRTAHPNCPFNPLHSRTCNADRSAGGTAHRPETGWIVRLTAGRVKHADPPNLARLLRARHERPRGRGAAQHCDELAPSHVLPSAGV